MTYSVFISHAWRYHAEYDRMVDLLDAASYFAWRNYSVPQHDPVIANDGAALARELDDQIRPSQVLLILGGIYVSHSDWIGYEIDRAVSWNKPIVGVRPWGSERLPAKLQENAGRIVGWNTTSVVQAVRDLA